jgi:glycosyltransferase involved in cell wall biosynthesis
MKFRRKSDDQQSSATRPSARILIVSQTFAPTGSEVALYNLLAGISDNSLIFDVLLTNAFSPVLKIDRYVRQIYCIRKVDRALGLLGKLFRRIFRRNGGAPNARIMRLKQLLRRGRYDLVYFNSLVFPDLIHYCSTIGTPYCVHVHELEHMYSMYDAQGIAALTHQARHLIFTSHAALDALMIFGCSAPRTVIQPGVHFPLANPKHPPLRQRAQRQRKFRWLGSGTSDFNKNIRLFVETANYLISNGANCEFIWIGADPQDSSIRWLRAYADTLGLKDHLVFLPRISDRASYLDELSAADAVMIPSFRESFSMVAVEALAYGKPVLTFANGGHSEYMTKQNGIVVANYDYEGFFQSAQKIMDRHRYYRSAQIRQSVRKFDIRRQSVRWHQTLESILNNIA